MAYLLVIVLYSAAQIALGLWIARRVRGSRDFFVAGRRLGPGLLFATMLAANIGGGSTIARRGSDAAIAVGVIAVVSAQLWNGGQPIGLFTPAMCGLAAAVLAFAATMFLIPSRVGGVASQK